MPDPLRLIMPKYIAAMNITTKGADALAPVAPSRTKVPPPKNINYPAFKDTII